MVKIGPQDTAIFSFTKIVPTAAPKAQEPKMSKVRVNTNKQNLLKSSSKPALKQFMSQQINPKRIEKGSSINILAKQYGITPYV